MIIAGIIYWIVALLIVSELGLEYNEDPLIAAVKLVFAPLFAPVLIYLTFTE